jgi:methylated-DNA-[protein]-cysteine S-methyltransferase
MRLAADQSVHIDDLSPVAFRHLSPHVATCPACQARWDRAVSLDEIRRQTEPSPEPLSASDVQYTSMPTPLGMLWIANGPQGLISADFNVDEPAFVHQIERRGIGVPLYAPQALASIVRQFAEYLAGQRTTFDAAVDLSGLRPFQRAVLEAVRAVPYGEVRSYGEIAWAVGKPAAARAVGTALSINPVTIVVPCHRIIRSDGSPGEYGYRSLGECGIHHKLLLLALEGVTFSDASG